MCIHQWESFHYEVKLTTINIFGSDKVVKASFKVCPLCGKEMGATPERFKGLGKWY
jgi:hypothetical protein